MEKMKTEHLKNKKPCKKCGHNHVFECGDFGINKNEIGLRFLESHDTCKKYEAEKMKREIIVTWEDVLGKHHAVYWNKNDIEHARKLKKETKGKLYLSGFIGVNEEL